jgi:hypothetical protein
MDGLRAPEYLHDPSVIPDNVDGEHFMPKMNV